MSQFVVNSGNAKRLHSPPSTSKFHSPTALESSISPVKKRRKYNFITREPCFVRRKEHKTGCLAAPENQPWPIGSQEPYVAVPQATDLLISPDFNHPRDIFTSVFSFWMRGINLYPERRKKERKERRKRKKEKEEIPYPVTMCALETFKALDAFEARSDDIVLASYPKCGSNWILHIVRELLSVVSEKKYEYSEFPVLECGDSEKYQRMKLFPSPRIMTTHLHYDKLPGSIIKSKAKILVIFRNPKDTAVSFFHFHNDVPDIPSYGSWDDFFRHFMKGQVSWGSYFDFAINWNKHLDGANIKFILYEDLKENLATGIKQIAEFLGFCLAGEQIQTISAQSTFQAMQAKSQETHGAVGPFLFRKGEVGDWKNLFSETQSQEMDEKFKTCLAGTPLGTKLKYELYCHT